METFGDKVKRIFVTMLIMSPVIVGKAIYRAHHQKSDYRYRYHSYTLPSTSSSYSSYSSDSKVMTGAEFLEKYRTEHGLDIEDILNEETEETAL